VADTGALFDTSFVLLEFFSFLLLATCPLACLDFFLCFLLLEWLLDAAEAVETELGLESLFWLCSSFFPLGVFSLEEVDAASGAFFLF